MSSTGPGAVHAVAGTGGVCDCTLVLSVWNCVRNSCSCVCDFCNFCARFWLDMVKFSTSSVCFVAACRTAPVAWAIWFSASAVSCILLTLLAYADVGAKPLSGSLFFQ